MIVDFIYDVATPNGYLTHKVVPEFEERTGTNFNYVPCLAGGIFKLTNNVPPLICLLYTSPSPRDKRQSRMPSSA